MSKVIHFFIELIFWIATFLSPVLISVLVAFILYSTLNVGFTLMLIIVIIGGGLGILFAERIRRKYGCANYWGRILATPDIWPVDEGNEKSKEKSE